MVRSKKGFVKTIEVIIAIVMSFVFLVLILPTETQKSYQESLQILPSFADDDEFRNCVIGLNDGCISQFIDPLMPPYLGYEILITTDPDEMINIADRQVQVETHIFAGNITTFSPTVLKLFYWEKG
ncbi:hypothetical protein COV93_03490 [Candidatus Woesearchaeota archaeon CG11_big_fil_rev_8_21_14_0_20_43_8]|nr:MAG: hypothetical protein COV93_03490 [Candidatus Woesearchaeota archaeon CG11_big_fil_rev_8_21_14_0_20_43_8]PIO05231.1 MAG: hypothetical protein COT47_05640 [Candidatus Woesearchaeota archaeon CG08_land_8_20_14_0_20_43_7]